MTEPFSAPASRGRTEGVHVQRRPHKREILERKRQVERARSGKADTAAWREAQQSALWLLDRSLERGHERLSALRLSVALELGAPLSAGHWAACRELLARRSESLSLRTALDRARARDLCGA